jgi:hypothetical protein
MLAALPPAVACPFVVVNIAVPVGRLDERSATFGGHDAKIPARRREIF